MKVQKGLTQRSRAKCEKHSEVEHSSFQKVSQVISVWLWFEDLLVSLHYESYKDSGWFSVVIEEKAKCIWVSTGSKLNQGYNQMK